MGMEAGALLVFFGGFSKVSLEFLEFQQSCCRRTGTWTSFAAQHLEGRCRKGYHSWTCPAGRMEGRRVPCYLLHPLPSLPSSCFPLPLPPPDSLTLGHLLLIRDQSQAHTYGTGGERGGQHCPVACPTCACLCCLTAAIRVGKENLLSLLLPDPRVMKVVF